MCMIAYRPHGKGAHIPNAVIDAAMVRHPDGFGLMWRDASGLHTMSYGPTAKKRFRKALKELDQQKVEYAAHFRFATSGPTDAQMAHPYVYDDPDPAVGSVALMHNGIISIKHDKRAESDTSAFVRLVLAELPSRWWSKPALVYLVNEAIGWSKFTIMTAHETVNLHEHNGEWDGGLWYSSDHRPTKLSTFKSTPIPPYVSQYGVQVDGKWTPASDPMYNERVAKAIALGANPNGVTVVQPLPTTSSALTLIDGGAKGAAARLGLLDEPDYCTRDVDAIIGFRHAGHNLTAIRNIDMDGGDADYEDAVICDTCSTIGTVYVIDSTYYIDMAHKSGADFTDDEGLYPDESEDLLPADARLN